MELTSIAPIYSIPLPLGDRADCGCVHRDRYPHTAGRHPCGAGSERQQERQGAGVSPVLSRGPLAPHRSPGYARCS